MKSHQRLLWSKTFLLLCCGFISGDSLGQFRNGRLIDERSGLSDVRVRAIVKDHDGFLWIGTQRGLNRFDGSQFRQFLHDPGDTASLLSNEILALFVDSQRLWIGGVAGISALNLTDYSLENIRFDCDSIIPGAPAHPVRFPHVGFLHVKDGILWISTRECGLVRYDPHTHDFRAISFAAHRKEIPEMMSSVALDLILGFAEDPVHDSIFWIGTASGLVRFNHQDLTHRLFYVRDNDLLRQDALNHFRRILYHDDGLIYYLTWGWGVNVFNPESGEFYPLPSGATEDRYLRHHVVSFRRHDAYQLWIRTPEGLYLYNTGLRKPTAFYPNENKSALYLGTDFGDDAGRRLFPTEDGMYFYDPLHEQFLVFSYENLNQPDWHGFARKVFQHPDGEVVTILGQSVDALYHFSHRTNSWFETPVPGFPTPEGEGFDGVDFAIDEKYGWIFSGVRGIYSFQPETYVISEIPINIPLERRQYTDLEWDHNGHLWIGTRHEGLLSWDPSTQTAQQYKSAIYGEGLIDSRPFAEHLYSDSHGHLWMVTGNGHSILFPDEKKFVNFSIHTPESQTMHDIARFAEDASGRIWAVTHDGLLAIGHSGAPEKGLVVEGSVFDGGVVPSYVEGIVYGDDHKMYVLCETALIRIDSTMELSHFSFDYATFIGDFFSFDKLSEASLVVGLRNSFAVLHSTGLKRNQELPVPYLTEVTINERPLTGNFLSSPPDLDLKHYENFISFSFSAISYTLSDHNIFRYRLRGFDPEWIEAGNRRFANYTNIPSGTYTFELEVANNEGIWNPKTYTVPVMIARPWWTMWWFRILSILAVVTAVIMAYRYRIAQIRKESELKAEFQRKIGDVELSALRAQMNPHFIFNCLNSIENYILKNESVKAAEYINDFARLIRLILQNSRSQYIPLTDEIEALDLYLQMEALRFDNKFDYRITVMPGLEPAETEIPPMMIQPFVENAIWHGLIPKHAPGVLRISLARENGELHCIIEDNGIGRDKSRELNASLHKRGKKSMGMLITRNRIDVYNELYQTHATVMIHDLKDEHGHACGTKVDLYIPVE